MAARSIATCLAEARTLLQDKDNTNPAYRYSDAELMEAFNGCIAEAKLKRPDLFLTFVLNNGTSSTTVGLRGTLPLYDTTMTAYPFPLDERFYNAFVWGIAGRTSMRDDTFVDNKRGVELMNKFTTALLQVMS